MIIRQLLEKNILELCALAWEDVYDVSGKKKLKNIAYSKIPISTRAKNK